eukprot:scaffold9751_cov153-Skeletonema_menzelii.AAC.7
MQSFKSDYAIEGLKALGSVNPKIKVVYLTRNPLDRKISNLRHNLFGKQEQTKRGQHNLTLAAHCKVDDVDCIKGHSAAASLGVTLPIGKNLTHWLNVTAQQDAKIREILRATGVEYVHVSYEKLYRLENAEEWMKIFRFLRVGPTEDLTVDDVRATFDLASTHLKGRQDIVSNFVEVVKTLKGTEFEHLLYD